MIYEERVETLAGQMHAQTCERAFTEHTPEKQERWRMTARFVLRLLAEQKAVHLAAIAGADTDAVRTFKGGETRGACRLGILFAREAVEKTS